MTKEDILQHFQDINGYYNDCMRYDDLKRMLDELISENKGEWIHKPHIYGVAYCSVCDYENKVNDSNFCPNCGADMRGGENVKNGEA